MGNLYDKTAAQTTSIKKLLTIRNCLKKKSDENLMQY